ncbi:MAG: hypothetical protein GY856_15210 [bacterium]|nr:hypothetical protein [bacterium]
MEIRELFEKWECQHREWQDLIHERPLDSLRLTERMLDLTNTLYQELKERTILDAGQSFHAIGDMETAERCFHVVLSDANGDQLIRAEAYRNLAAVRSFQDASAEALRLIERAESLIETSAEHGKNLLETGVIHFRAGSYEQSALASLESLSCFDSKGRYHALAAHNCMAAVVMLEGAGHKKLAHKIAAQIRVYRESAKISPHHSVFADWLRLTASIIEGRHAHAIKQLPKIQKRLRRGCFPELNLALVDIDLAQAFYLSGSHSEACDALERAANYYDDKHPICEFLEKFRQQKKMPPWSIRHLADRPTGLSDRQQRETDRLRQAVNSLLRNITIDKLEK